MSFFGDLMHPGRAYKKAGEEYDKYYQQAQGYADPYNQMGQAAGQNFQAGANALMDPTALQNQWASSYQMSPQAQNAMRNATNSGMDAASQMGLMGSSAALGNIQNQAGQIMQSDQQNYLNDLMTKYGMGMSANQNIYGTGANMAGQMGQNAMNAGNFQATRAFNQADAAPSLFGKALGGATTLAASVLGGPIGGALAGGLSSYLNGPAAASQGPSMMGQGSYGMGQGMGWGGSAPRMPNYVQAWQ